MNTRSEVVKRDGSIVPYQPEKVRKVVKAAFMSVHNEVDDLVLDNITDSITALFTKNNQIPVEVIQDEIENWLMHFHYFEVAKAFILYREKHRETRLLKDRIKYMTDYVNSGENAATSSEEDSNSNVTIKNVANLNGEVYKNYNRRIQRMLMKNKLNKLYPNKNLGDQYIKDLEHHIIYAHDESSFPIPTNYCEAVSLYPLLLDGTSTMDGLRTTPPKNLTSFCGQLVNLTFLLAAQCKGAVAFGEFFNFFDYFCVKDFGENYHTEDNEKKIKQAFQNIVYSWNQPAGNRSYQSPFININYFDSNYWKAMFRDFYFPDGTQPKWERVNYLQKLFMKWFNAERKKTLLTFPVESMALLTNGKEVIDWDYKDFASEMWSDGHSFFMYLSDNADSLASCCRLRNEVTNNEFSFTTGLTGIKTGSCNVITLNLNRIVQDIIGKDPKQFTLRESFDIIKPHLENLLNRIYKYHIAYKTMLYELEDKGMLTASKAGYIDMKSLFSTIGLNGLNDAAEFLGIKCSDNEDYKSFIQLITGTISEQNKKHSTKQFKFNQEFVPAESLGSKNYNWDKEDGYIVNPNRNLYNSYIYLADDENTSVLDRFVLHGKDYTGLMDGGVGLHCNLSEHLSKEQYHKLIDFAIANGTSYFTFNIPNTECKNCGFITKVPIEECPNCKSKNVRHWTRTIGYLRPIECFDKHRKEEAKTRVYHGRHTVYSE
jgi:ribonucleoside-triphosphate reductase